MYFTYRIKWSKNQTSYYGVRYKDSATVDSIMTTYFTSSKYVHEYIKAHGMPDVVDIRKIFDTKTDAKKWEERVINKGKLFLCPKWLNCGNNGSFKNVVMDDAMRKKISDAKKNKPYVKSRMYTDGVSNTKVYDGQTIPYGFVIGKTFSIKQLANNERMKTLSASRTPEQKKNSALKHSATMKGRKKPEGFGERISKANRGKKHPHLCGANNVSKRPDVRAKISKSWETRERIRWFTNKLTREAIWVCTKDVGSINLDIFEPGKEILGAWFNDGVKSIWVRHNSCIDVTQLTSGKKFREKNQKIITNGVVNKQLRKGDDMPDGFHYGKTQTNKAKGTYKYYNDGIKTIIVNIGDQIPFGFNPGKIKRNK